MLSGGLLQMHLPQAVLHLVGWLPPGKDYKRASELAAGVGIEVWLVWGYCLELLPGGGLLFGYGCVDKVQIPLALQKLAPAL